jgi:uncharacterized protein YcfJ
VKVSFLAGALAGAVVVTAGGAIAGYQAYQEGHSAKVISANPVTRTVKIPRQDCHQEQVNHKRPVKDSKRLLGTGLGAAIGGVLGHQIGGGNGKTLATVAGVAAGGYAGNQIQKKTQDADTYTTNEQRCNTVYDTSQEPAGFDVVYEYDGHRQHVHMDQDPGASLPVKDGKVVTNQTKGSSNSA